MLFGCIWWWLKIKKGVVGVFFCYCFSNLSLFGLLFYLLVLVGGFLCMVSIG